MSSKQTGNEKNSISIKALQSKLLHWNVLKQSAYKTQRIVIRIIVSEECSAVGIKVNCHAVTKTFLLYAVLGSEIYYIYGFVL